LLAAVIVPIVVVGLVAVAALGFMLKQLQRARKRSIIGKVSHPAAFSAGCDAYRPFARPGRNDV
jgi:hypothetical protein